MNTTDIVVIICAALIGGGITAGGIFGRRALRDAAFNHYRLKLSASAEFVPAAPRVPPVRAQAAGKPGSVIPGAHGPGLHASKPAEPALTAVGETLTRKQAAAALHVAEITVRRREDEWGLEKVRQPHPLPVLLTAESVRRAAERMREAS